MEKLIVSLVGHPASGKTSTARYMQEEHGFTPFSFSRVIRDYAAKEGISLNRRADYANAHTRMLEERGWDYTVRLALGLETDRVCVDDVRSLPYVDILRKAGGIEVAFECPSDIRFIHGQNHADVARYPHEFAAFIQNEQDDDAVIIGPGLRFETDRVMRDAHYRLDASGTLENTFRQMGAILMHIERTRQ